MHANKCRWAVHSPQRLGSAKLKNLVQRDQRHKRQGISPYRMVRQAYVFEAHVHQNRPWRHVIPSCSQKATPLNGVQQEGSTNASRFTMVSIQIKPWAIKYNGPSIPVNGKAHKFMVALIKIWIIFNQKIPDLEALCPTKACLQNWHYRVLPITKLETWRAIGSATFFTNNALCNQ